MYMSMHSSSAILLCFGIAKAASPMLGEDVEVLAPSLLAGDSPGLPVISEHPADSAEHAEMAQMPVPRDLAVCCFGGLMVIVTNISLSRLHALNMAIVAYTSTYLNMLWALVSANILPSVSRRSPRFDQMQQQQAEELKRLQQQWQLPGSEAHVQHPFDWSPSSGLG